MSNQPAHLTTEALLARQFPNASKETIAKLAKSRKKNDADTMALYYAALYD
ncbi:MAG: hypothetical protein GY811_06025 [Myxococcales bacterium]|nr:hypothetical protein [Myxococcales bacterium]